MFMLPTTLFTKKFNKTLFTKNKIKLGLQTTFCSADMSQPKTNKKNFRYFFC